MCDALYKQKNLLPKKPAYTNERSELKR